MEEEKRQYAKQAFDELVKYVDDVHCDNCIYLKQHKAPRGARGQMITAWGDGTTECDAEPSLRPYEPYHPVRTINCILRGLKKCR